MSRPNRVVGAGAVPAPATLPDRPDVVDVDAELVDLLCEDEDWLEETFRDIVAASWAGPPPPGTVRPAAGPRRHHLTGRRREGHHAGRGSQWTAPRWCRQRSPPRGTRA
jgi:hypothetical protein